MTIIRLLIALAEGIIAAVLLAAYIRSGASDPETFALTVGAAYVVFLALWGPTKPLEKKLSLLHIMEFAVIFIVALACTRILVGSGIVSRKALLYIVSGVVLVSLPVQFALFRRMNGNQAN